MHFFIEQQKVTIQAVVEAGEGGEAEQIGYLDPALKVALERSQK